MTQGCNTCWENCDIPQTLKGIWAGNEELSYHIVADESPYNQFFDEGFAINEATLPYVVLSENAAERASESLGSNAFLDVKTYQLRIYGSSRRLLKELSRVVRSEYTNSLRIGNTAEGNVCGVKCSTGTYTLFRDGTRMVSHQIRVMVTNKL